MNKLKKRRLKSKLLGNKVKIIIGLVLGFSFLFATGYAVSNTLIEIDGRAGIAEEKTCKYDIDASFELGNSWGDNDGKTIYMANITIENKGPDPIVGWTIVIKGPSDLDSQWVNANVTQNNGVATLTPYDWNGTIGTTEPFNLQIAFKTVETSLNISYITFNGCKIYGEGAPSDEDDPSIPDPIVKLESLEINPSTYEMTIGESALLQVIKTPANVDVQYTFTSSNPTVATVDNSGRVVALNPGTTTITVTADDVTATSLITVIDDSTEPDDPNPDKPDDPIPDVPLSGTFASSNHWGHTAQFDLTITNTGDTTIDGYTFYLVVPSKTTFTVWYAPGLTITGNKFEVTTSIAPGGKYSFGGQMTVPDDYNIEDYLNPEFINFKTK